MRYASLLLKAFTIAACCVPVALKAQFSDSTRLYAIQR